MFENRTGKYLNRKRLKIISQTPTEMIVDMERADEVEKVGTPINAQTFQTFQNQIDTANTNSSTAVTTATNANTTATNAEQTANTAQTTANTAKENAETALTIANEAKTISTNVESLMAEKGVTVYIDETPTTTLTFTSDPQEQINSKLTNDAENIKTNVLNAAYPIGSIYLSVNNTDPSNLFGGTWEQISDRFLLGASSTYSAGSVGGEVSHTLTTAEMPSHTHIQNGHNHSQDGHSHGLWSVSNYGYDCGGFANSNAKCGVGGPLVSGGGASENYYHTDIEGSTLVQYTTPYIHYSTPTNQYTGGSSAHNNMPPYLAVYIWKRTA